MACMLFCCLTEIDVEFAVLRCCELSVFMAGGGVGFYSGDLRTVNQVSSPPHPWMNQL
jgi:hypothetical protein